MKYLSLLILITLFSCNASQKTAETSSGNINASAPYKWTSAFPKTIHLSSDFTTSEASALASMATAWSSAVSNQKTFYAIGTPVAEKTSTITNFESLYDSTFGVYKSTDWPMSIQATALAVTQIFGRRYNVGDSNEYVAIEHADIIVNYDYYDFDTADSGSGYDFRTVVLHEMGHFIGLQHKSTSSTRADSVMYPSISDSEFKRAPLPVDIYDVATKYSLSGGATAQAATRFEPRSGDAGQIVKIIMELHANGECVHRENGVVVHTHEIDQK